MRSGYSDDLDTRQLNLYRGRVQNAIRGRRGQQLLRDSLASLDAMPHKRLIAHELSDGNDVCLLGAAGRGRGLDDGFGAVDPSDHEAIGSMLDVAPCLAAEVEFVNDECGPYGRQETPEERWVRVRKWVAENLGSTAELVV